MGNFRPKFHNLDNIFQQNITPKILMDLKLGGAVAHARHLRVQVGVSWPSNIRPRSSSHYLWPTNNNPMAFGGWLNRSPVLGNIW